MDGNETLDIVVGTEDRKLLLHRNRGSNESPVFATPEPLRYSDGAAIELRPYLEGKERTVRFADGTVNPTYPTMPIINVHGGRIHLCATPAFADWSGSGQRNLIVGTQGDFLLYFRRTASGFERGVFVRDEAGAPLRPGTYLTVADWRGAGALDLLCGDYHGRIRYLQHRGADGRAPVFSDHGTLSVVPDVEYGFALAAVVRGQPCLLAGNFYGEVKRYDVTGWGAMGTPLLDRGTYVEMRNAWITRYMPVAQYTDLDGDGRRDIVSGDIKGGVFSYRNTSTNRNPLFESGHHLRDTDGPIRLDRGPDPFCPRDGYSKVAVCDVTGDGRPDLLVGSGLGRVWHFVHDGTDEEGVPRFWRGEVLRDTCGNEVRSHHMSAVTVADWDGDGVPDLIVGGQTRVHAHDDDDPGPSQVRWYRGRRRPDNRLEFEPYLPLNAEGDEAITYRPCPVAVTEEAGQRVLHIGRALFRQTDPAHPEAIAFDRFQPQPLVNGRERIITAAHTRAELAAGDPVWVQGSCVGTLFAFREAFVLNRGYLAAECRCAMLESRDRALREIISGPIRHSAPAPGAARRQTVTKEREYAVQSRETPAADACLRGAFWTVVAADDAFLDGTTHEPPARELCPAVQWLYTAQALWLRVRCPEPLMSRIIRIVEHHNGPIDAHDDHVRITLDPGYDPEFFGQWIINANGHYREVRRFRETGETRGPWQFGTAEAIRVAAACDDTGWTLICGIPFTKLGVIPQPGTRWPCNVGRVRSLYANQVTASEQRIAGQFTWSARPGGSVGLRFA